jgi:GTP-binding protein
MRLDAEFVCSSLTLADCPHWKRLEVGLVGRSNVGKSSLLNALAGSKNLARISKTPGRTRYLNFFSVGKYLALVDLPGFGYSKIPHAEAERIAVLMRQFLLHRGNLQALLLLIDARRGPQMEEFALTRLVLDPAHGGPDGRRVLVVATKCDKLTSAQRDEALRRFVTAGVAPLMCSAVTGEGIDQLRHQILALPSVRFHGASQVVGGSPRQGGE